MYEHVTPRQSLRYLRDIGDESKCFYTKDGTKLTNLFDLYHYIKTCDEDSFSHHTNESRNDFAEWVGSVILDQSLSSVLSNCILREPMQYRLLRRINHLVSYPSFNLDSLPKHEKARIILEPAQTKEEAFISSDGKIIRDLWDLSDFLRLADQDALDAHISDGKNDIADWVDEVLLDDKLAGLLRKQTGRDQMILFTALRLNELAKHLGSKDQIGSYCMRVKKSLGSNV
jgi:hypothetical protein